LLVCVRSFEVQVQVQAQRVLFGCLFLRLWKREWFAVLERK